LLTYWMLAKKSRVVDMVAGDWVLLAERREF
jgi:hypothetical protein